MTTDPNLLAVALKAIELYAASHPRPAHVTQKQAAEMLGRSEPTIRKMVQFGTLKLNACGMIPIAQIDAAIAGG
jgi:transcription initiation factor TFIIIB Brf1 subunit/transcription initiation factor TFIIB